MGFFNFFLGIAVYLWAVFVEKTVWNWFMPLIFGLPELSLAEMGGVAVLLGLLRARVRNEDIEIEDDNEKKIIKLIGYAFVYATGLGIAYLWRLAI